MVHLKTTFNDTIRMERLLSVLKGEAKRSEKTVYFMQPLSNASNENSEIQM